ncbi:MULTISPECIES: DUF2946 family protein [Pseudomonas]|uniref:DUF2946 domain-containing protein n=1 Tax=Pseudomonas kilonensis TaxID=132476 RepID=A0ABY0ZCS5_9PSED|nr:MULTISPECIES: DUF2946 family protein [Pseudomonas]AHL34818.1 hypothetical protein CD58_18900 [Pseudomonas brassicacearum]RON04671.1 hypothetical protein BK657_10805 [Pseudomonas brassicacearum]BBP52619.1 hypothetical protein PHLH3_22450 [Pseudomonas sp. St386]SEE53353.1 hypothetical protein SAMN04490188_4275 [Pseudomonas kilonensis]
MKLASREKSMIAWVLYFSILFGSLLCAMGHGQMAGLRLSGLDGGLFCSTDGGAIFEGLQDVPAPSLPVVADCVIASLFGAILLAAFFGLLALLAGEPTKPLPAQPTRCLPRQRWPLINPRASPALLPSP